MATPIHMRCFQDTEAMPFDRLLVRWRVMALDYDRDATHRETTSDCRNAKSQDGGETETHRETASDYRSATSRDDVETEKETEIDTARRQMARCGRVDAAILASHRHAAGYRTEA